MRLRWIWGLWYSISMRAAAPAAELPAVHPEAVSERSQRLRELAFLNAGVRIQLLDERGEKKRSHDFHYEGGISQFVSWLNENKELLHPTPIYVKGTRDGVECEIAIQYNQSYREQLYTYCNNINTIEGGSHLVGFKAALTRTINTYATSAGLLKKSKTGLSGEDVREGLTCIISVKVPEPQFEGQTKTKLGNSEVKGFVETLLGRRRYVPELKSRNWNIRQFGERIAQNTPIQGTAADIMKVAMVAIQGDIETQELASRMVLTVHDELVFESPPDEIETVQALVKDIMENIWELRTPLMVNISKGSNWAEAH